MYRFRVVVTASFREDVHLLRLLCETPRGSDTPTGLPHLESSATNWLTSADGRIAPTLQILTVNYDGVEGPDEERAEEFALAIFETERRRAGLPEPETVVARTE